MTVLHLAAKFGHVDVLEVLRGKVPWSMASVKVKMLIYCHIFIPTQSRPWQMVYFLVLLYDEPRRDKHVSK